MILNVYSVFDSAVSAYTQPFFLRSDGEAIRSFQGACNEPDSNFRKHPLDYTLFKLGTWDDAGGVLDCSPPVRLISAMEVIVKEDPPSSSPGSKFY